MMLTTNLACPLTEAGTVRSEAVYLVLRRPDDGLLEPDLGAEG